MTLLLVLVVIAVTVVSCFKAYHSAKLLEKDPEAVVAAATGRG
jgi:hypothetical protein